MKRLILLTLLLAGCAVPRANPTPTRSPQTLVEARRGFKTKLTRQVSAHDKIPDPPAALFRKVTYPAPGGKMGAYISQAPADATKLPAIIWITGGDCNTIGDVWRSAPPSNDQTAAAFRKEGIVTMYPSLRGGNDNPGFQEGFLGEVDDVLAAADFLAAQPQVDPRRIYLGGHSSGGTLALLVAECSDRFRATFSFGPVEDVGTYGPEMLPFDLTNPRELQLRATISWLTSIRSPVFVFEGTNQGNMASLRALSKANKNPMVHFYAVRGATHFSILAPTTALVAKKILQDGGPTPQLTFTESELNAPFK